MESPNKWPTFSNIFNTGHHLVIEDEEESPSKWTTISNMWEKPDCKGSAPFQLFVAKSENSDTANSRKLQQVKSMTWEAVCLKSPVQNAEKATKRNFKRELQALKCCHGFVDSFVGKILKK